MKRFMILLLSIPFCVFLIVGCSASDEQRILVQKALGKRVDCVAIGDKPFRPAGRYIVWDLQTASLHSVTRFLDFRLSIGKGPHTVFLVSKEHSRQVGTYSVSGEPAYRQWVNVCVVKFLTFNDTGTALASHEVVSLDPRDSRVVVDYPEYGDVVPLLSKWLDSLEMKDKPKKHHRNMIHFQ